MKVIVNFGEKKVVVPCGTNGDISIRELIQIATTKYCKLVRIYIHLYVGHIMILFFLVVL